ncbi:ATP-binding protein [Hymenobacter sp. BRD67]|uniref:PAS domain-containing sensor histidine kinase n=1 Tax=Hymenobacter sp. BRD67 TaxID=2675877 RepID=UPI00156325C4|nr:ATP-binding protein [Hymenobacter sp. BRD67]QKG53144.1 hypothetical protein GKZ67_11730 [Hymenobacter sp. BRD67]
MSFPTAFITSFLQQSPQVFFVYEVQPQRVSYVSAAYEELLQGHCERVNEELPGLLARIHPDDYEHALDCWHRWRGGQLREPFELRLRTPEGVVQYLSITPHWLAGPDGDQVGGLLEDVSATKTALWHADKYNTKKNTTLEILSHELAGPFSVLQQMSDYFHEAVAPLQDVALTTMIDHMRDLCRDSIGLIRDFVDHEFLDSVNVVLRRERIELVEKLRLLITQYQTGSRYTDKHFGFEAEGVPIFVEMDQNKFMQAINNLMSNAIKFTPDGGTITLRVVATASHALITVADTGIGIPVALQAGLFEKFTRARRPGLRGERSTGLGMSIIKTIIELHEGSITFQSAEGKGTTFLIELPLAG